jgi:hypothetical protein
MCNISSVILRRADCDTKDKFRRVDTDSGSLNRQYRLFVEKDQIDFALVGVFLNFSNSGVAPTRPSANLSQVGQELETLEVSEAIRALGLRKRRRNIPVPNRDRFPGSQCVPTM